MHKKRYHLNPNKQQATRKKEALAYALKLLLSLIMIVILYFLSGKIINSLRADTTLFFYPVALGVCMIVIIGWLILLIGIFPIQHIKKTIKTHKKTVLVIATITVLVFLLPIPWIHSGLRADYNGIRKVGIFGQTKWQYSYQEIQQVELSAYKRGIQYNITFHHGKTILLESHHVYPEFKDDKNLVAFDQLIRQHTSIYIDPSDFYLFNSDNIRRFFKTEEGFAYFDHYIQNYISDYHKEHLHVG